MENPKADFLNESIELIESIVSLLDTQIYFMGFKSSSDEVVAKELLEIAIDKINKAKLFLNV